MEIFKKSLIRNLTFALGCALAASAQAEEVKVLQRGDQSLSAFYQAIASANKTIDIATFLMEPCQAAPKFLLDAIVKKAKSGVKVRIVVEAYTFKEPNKSGLAAWLESASKTDSGAKNIELRLYGTTSAFAMDPPRSHSKIFVVDANDENATQIVGGRNWTDEYFGMSAKLNYLDQDLLIRGQSARDAGKYFNELWQASSKVAVSGDGKAYGASCMAKNARANAVAQFIQGRSASILGSRPSYSCGNVDYVNDNPQFMDKDCGGGGPDSDFLGAGECLQNKRTSRMAWEFMKGTRAKLLINNQYYLPYGRIRSEIDHLRDTKKDIEVFSNATGDIETHPTNNKMFTCWIQRSGFETFKGTQKVRLLTSEGTLRDSWALTPGNTKWRIHTKTMIRDDRDVLVSSWNMDPRSLQTNLESGVVIEGCAGLAADLNAQYEQLRATAKADQECVPCKAQFIPGNMKDGAFCGPAPVTAY